MPTGGASTGHSRLSCQASAADDGCPGWNATDERNAEWNGYVGSGVRGLEGITIGVLFEDSFGSNAWAKGFDALMKQRFGTYQELGYCIGLGRRDGGVFHGLRIEAGHYCNLGLHIDTLAEIPHPVQDAIISDLYILPRW